MKQILIFSGDMAAHNLRNHEVTILEEFKKSGELEQVESGYMRTVSIPKRKVGLAGNDDAKFIAMTLTQFQSQWNDNDLKVKVANHDMIVSNYEEIVTFKVSH